MPTDLELFEAWRTGDRAAGEALFERHFDSVLRMFRNKIAEGADDLVQRTFLACLEHADRIRDAASFRSYLLTIARNELFMQLRRRVRVGNAFDPSMTSVQDIEPTPSQELAKREEQKLLLRALRCIPVDAQIILELTYWEAMSGPELAEVLGIPEGTVRSRQRRARRQVEEAMTALASNPATLEAVVSGFDSWAESLRDAADKR